MNLDHEKKAQEVSLNELIALFLNKLKLITFITLSFAIFSIFYSLSLPNFYTSTALLIKTNNDQSAVGLMSQISGIANIAGISLPSDASNDRSIEALEKIKSFEFFNNNFLPKINLHDLMAVKDWQIDTNKLIYDESSFDSKNNKWVRDVSYPKKTVPSAQEAYITYKSIMNISLDKKTSFITLSVKHNSPNVSKEWSEIIISEVNNSMREKDKVRAMKSIQFLNDQLSTVIYEEIREAISLLQKEQMKSLMVIESTDDYILSVLDSPIAPEIKSSPNRALICSLITIFGFVLSLLIVILQNNRKFINN